MNENSLNKNETGIALLFTLGILSLLLLLALSFATTTSIERKSAEVNNDATSARMLADSAFERIMAGLSFYTQSAAFKDMPADKVISYSITQNIRLNGSDDDGNNADVDMIKTTDSEDSPFETTKSNGYEEDYYPYDPNDGIQWTYVVDNCSNVGGGSAADKRIIGRYAYVVKGTGGKITPEACSSESGSVKRYGINVREINLRYLGLTGGDVTGLKPFCDDYFTNGTKIADYTALTGSFTPSSRDDFIERMSLPSGPDTNESFEASGKDYHRFFLPQTQSLWDDNTTMFSRINSAAVEFDLGTIAENTGGIPYLAGNNQVIANLIDYCDSDYEATTNDADDPNYVGLEKVPLINEVDIDVTVEAPPIPGGSAPNFTYNYTVTIDVFVELVNMFSSTVSVTPEVAFEYSYNYVQGDGTSTPKSGSYVLNSTAITLTPGTVLAGEYKRVPAVGSPTSIIVSPPPVTSANNALGLAVDDFKISNLKVRLIANPPSGPVMCDFAVVNDATGHTISNTMTDGSTESLYFEVKDPRHNLSSSEWEEGNLSLAAANTPYSDPTSGDDGETATDVVDISTAYIRNEPMICPWELGFIHRGAAWQTLNLKKYNSNSATLGAYVDGDANILDQVKMGKYKAEPADFDFTGAQTAAGDSQLTEVTQVYGKVPLNTKAYEVLQALLTDIRYGSKLMKDSGGNTGDPLEASAASTVTEAEAKSIAQAVVDATGGGINPLKHRGEIADFITAKGLGSDDASREEIIGKMINLCRLSSNAEVFTVIVVAQSIRDVGAFPDGTTNQKVADAAAKNITINGRGNCAVGQFDMGADVILAEQKILAVVSEQTNSNNKSEWKIMKYMYLED